MKCFGVAVLISALSLAIAQPRVAAGQAISGDPETAPVEAAAPAVAPAGASSPRYFIEFRSRSALSYGHSFVVFGRAGERLTSKNVAGLHPRGNSPVTYVIGHVLPVPSETGASDGDLDTQYITARYRVALTARQYAALIPKIRELQAGSPAWNAVAYNCNAFVGDIAHLVGLSSPPPWMLPEDYVNSLRAMNEPASGAARHASVRR